MSGIIADLKRFKIDYSSDAEFTSLLNNCKDVNTWEKCVESGSVHCLDLWLSDRAKVKAKRDAANEIKVAPLLNAISSGNVTVSRGTKNDRSAEDPYLACFLDEF